MPKLSELGERFLVKYILQTIEWPREGLLPPGDDAAAYWFNGMLVTSVDMLVWDTDVPPGMTHRQAGWKAAVSAISDVASKGGKPKYLLLSLGLNPSTEFKDFQELLEGLRDAAQKYGANIIGGDLNEHHTTSISVTVIGAANHLISRKGAGPGDLIATTGLFGKTYAGLHALLNSKNADEKILEAVYLPQARVSQGLALAASGGVSSCIDSSDGLAESLHLLAEMNNVGFEVDSLPIDPAAEKYCRENNISMFDAVFYGGEEYELVFTVKKGWEDVVEQALKKAGGRLIRLGRVTKEPSILFRRGEGAVPVERKGWQHFQRLL
ncbi:MAG: thiamine-phosphate kinase [Candidatus Caldarchaeum sp.]|nr:thiamine-phosphate kinase [Candidatus Caldarchaeum sp.]